MDRKEILNQLNQYFRIDNPIDYEELTDKDLQKHLDIFNESFDKYFENSGWVI